MLWNYDYWEGEFKSINIPELYQGVFQIKLRKKHISFYKTYLYIYYTGVFRYKEQLKQEATVNVYNVLDKIKIIIKTNDYVLYVLNTEIEGFYTMERIDDIGNFYIKTK